MKKSAFGLVFLVIMLNGVYADLVERTWTSNWTYANPSHENPTISMMAMTGKSIS